MEDPKTAIAHFVRFPAAVATPISLGRAGYWLGLATWGVRRRRAAAAFAMAAQYQTSFYGQLAAGEARGPPAIPASRAPVRPPDSGGMLPSCSPRWCRPPTGCISPTTTAAPRSSSARPPRAGRRHARCVAQMAIDLGRPQIGIRIAKDAAADADHPARPVLSAAPHREGELAGADRVRDGDRAAGIRALRRAATMPGRTA